MMLRPHGDTRVVLRSGAAGQHAVVVARAEELAAPSTVVLPAAAPSPGLILPDGTINWGCPCLGGMATGPCGMHFRAAFSCFHYSEADPKGSDCYEKFSEMQSCMSRYPELYARDDDEMPASPGTPGDPADPAILAVSPPTQ